MIGTTFPPVEKFVFVFSSYSSDTFFFYSSIKNKFTRHIIFACNIMLSSRLRLADIFPSLIQ